MHKFIIITCAVFLCFSCSNKTIMTEQERNLIENGNEDTAFRVLTIENADDLLVLRTVCTNVNIAKDSALIAKLIARMKATMIDERGVGIAAPQIGISRNVFLFVRIDKPGNPIEVAINPKITNKAAETFCFEGDGCLSIPGQSGNSVRYQWIEVEYFNAEGKKIHERLDGYSRHSDFTGIIFQHEFDHLQGVLYTDKLYDKN